MDESSSTFIKKPANKNLESAIGSLLDLCNDKDDQVKGVCEASLVRIASRNPNELINYVINYKKKNQKISEQTIAVILRIIEHVITIHIRELDNEVIINVIKFVINEITRQNEPVHSIQKPCKEILFGIGREHCKLVMDELTAILQPHQVGHFMILETLGTLTRSNLDEAVTYIKGILGTIIPMISLLKADFQRQSYAVAIQNFCDAISEYQTNVDRSSNNSHLSCEPDVVTSEDEDSETQVIPKSKLVDVSAEVGIIYDVFMQQWINTRNSKLCSEFLIVLSYMYPLLPVQKILDNTGKIIHTLLMMYKRSIDRSSISIYLNSVIHTTSRLDGRLLESQVDSVVNAIFDLICVNPDFEKPIAVRSHNEVLRCYDLVARNYGDKVNDLILVKFKAYDDSEKVKALILLTHLTNTSEDVVKLKVNEYLIILRQMIMSEKTFKTKQIILRSIVAFAQKGFIKHKIFIKFIIHHCCHLVKIQTDQGTKEEAAELVRSCNNTLKILSRTLNNGLENLLKTELLHVFMQYEYTDATTTFAQCLTTLFLKDDKMFASIADDETDTQSMAASTESITGGDSLKIPSAESIFVRCLVLMANFDDKERIKSILNFLIQFCPNLSGKHLQVLWKEKINQLMELVKINDDDKFYKDLNIFIMDTIKDIDEPKFSESLVNKMSDQFILYQSSFHVYSIHPSNQNQLNTELIVQNLRAERGMLMRIMGLCLCYVTDPPSIDTKIDIILNQVKIEKLEKVPTFQEFEEKFFDPAKAFGFISKGHFDLLMKKFESIIVEDGMKKSSSFFSSLNFTKDSQKEGEKYRLKILIIFSLYYITQSTAPQNIIKNDEDLNDKIIDYLNRMLSEIRECQIKKIILETLLKITEIYIEEQIKDFKYINDLLASILNIPIENTMGSGSNNQNFGNYGFYDYLPLYPTVIKLATNLVKLSPIENGNLDATNLLDISSQHFFTAAQNLNIEDEAKQSYLAPHINSSIPELNIFIKILLDRNPSPSALDDISSIFEKWLKDKNSQVKICAALIMEKTLDSYIKTVKIGCEAPSKFHQTGNMLGKIVPRCIDSNAKVREICVNILKKILELACIYETLTIADENTDWMKELKDIRDKITNNDNDEIIVLAQKLANIIAMRLSNQQYVTFSKALLYNLNDPDWSASAGAALVLNSFIQVKGSEIFHAIPDLVKDSFHALKVCDNSGTRTNIYLSLVSLTKFHPKLVCAEMLMQPLPYDENICEYWHSLTSDNNLTGTIVDNILETIYEVPPYDNITGSSETSKILTHSPFANICAFRELIFSKDKSSVSELKKRFAPIFSMLLTTLAAYINTIPSMVPPVQVDVEKIKVPSSASKNSKGTRFGFISNRDPVKVIPSQIVIDTFIKLMDILENENVKTVLQSFPQMSSSTNLNNFMEFLTPLAVGIASSHNINSSEMKDIIHDLSKYSSSTVDAHRIAFIGFFSQLVPLRPCGDISSTIMLHLTAALSDPVASVRAFCIRGLAYVSELNKHDIEKYSELSLAALLKGMDDFNASRFINIPLESLRGLSRVIKSIPKEKLDLFEVSLTIRIRPFFDNHSVEIRESAILLFGDLCYQTKLYQKGNDDISEALREQLITNLFPFLLHLCETESIIVRACKIALRNVSNILGAKQLNEKIQLELQEYQQLNYDHFIHELIRIICTELPDNVPTFIESCLPYLKSQWREIQLQAIQHIGLLHHFGSITTEDNYRTELETTTSEKIITCLKDEQVAVKLKAAEALGNIFSSENP
ncbi:maestro heat-like repeat-containing protein family member 1 isoform X2 [Chironomus tepperi]|uniref:maestro heat-like repeat-containing protein family member 1 isoform X2 n=1 Tax=Chironomus tepperi TaxID=113505 RepID=UPI00391F4CD6